MSGYLQRIKCLYLDWSVNMLWYIYIYIESVMNVLYVWILMYSVGVRIDLI